jgi:hypothetical protein
MDAEAFSRIAYNVAVQTLNVLQSIEGNLIDADEGQ